MLFNLNSKIFHVLHDRDIMQNSIFSNSVPEYVIEGVFVPIIGTFGILGSQSLIKELNLLSLIRKPCCDCYDETDQLQRNISQTTSMSGRVRQLLHPVCHVHGHCQVSRSS